MAIPEHYLRELVSWCYQRAADLPGKARRAALANAGARSVDG